MIFSIIDVNHMGIDSQYSNVKQVQIETKCMMWQGKRCPFEFNQILHVRNSKHFDFITSNAVFQERLTLISQNSVPIFVFGNMQVNHWQQVNLIDNFENFTSILRIIFINCSEFFFREYFLVFVSESKQGITEAP